MSEMAEKQMDPTGRLPPESLAGVASHMQGR